MRNHQYTEIKEMLARHRTLLETTNRDIGDIKQQLIPNGVSRLDNVEQDVKSLNRYSNAIGGIIALVTSIPLIKMIFDMVKDS